MGDRQVVIGVAVLRAGQVLVARRGGADGGWEFPGGKVEPGETDEAAGERELVEELGVHVSVGKSFGLEEPIGDRYLLRVYFAELVAGEPVLHEHAEIRWVGPAELDELDWLAPDRPFLPVLREQLTSG
ncbi:8-oxo-dGTP diphosphatase [Kribbella voronezhensis]|uniref:8-oxo-dGTP diphosphatase n=1 Tax=Kribbella voronezhensis TaxID=2512212 RepID=A0A4R7THY8_9ACTN|nr:(deoxy)nucleoside triphosphate pyrophosphohydrolase [Kribbella voronezhensis]TDU91509.1 8-oxo-dGTP diphosphatase [Kribbella voronezhensis]